MKPTETFPHPTPTIPADEQRNVTPNFITEIIDDDLRAGRVTKVVTRFPPEPNGYLHIGHAKAIFLDFGVAQDYGGVTFLRYDDTNPVTEDPEYVAAIERDVRWLGFEWEEVRHASDYFEQLYDMAVRLIQAGDAYVDSSSEETIRLQRGTVTEAGVNSADRDRSVAENLDLFARMRDGEFGPGEMVLRAKADMASPNMKMRDPILYRIVDAQHYRTGSEWPIYPMYDFAHPLSDAIEGISHSLCTLEFENNREIYDWLVERLIDGPRPYQYEFARLQLDYTVVSKRKLIRLVHEGLVTGWDDPRMPTLAALRRKGVTPEAIREFTNRIGVAKANSRTDLALLDSAIRDDLNPRAPRVMAVLEPLRVTLTNMGQDERIDYDAPYWPHDVPREGSRSVTLTRHIVIERSDFQAEPQAGFRRLAPGRAVRLRHGPVIRCDEVVTDDDGNVVELLCHVFKESAGTDSVGANPAGVKVWSALHWVSERHGLPFTARLYEPLFLVRDPDGAPGDMLDHVNPEAQVVMHGLIEPSVAHDDPDTRYQFERTGYFWRDPVDGRSPGGPLVFNRIVNLKSAWDRQVASQESRAAKGAPAAKPDAPQRAAQAPDGSPGPEQLRPDQRQLYERLVTRDGVTEDAALILASRPPLARFYADTVAAGAPAISAANWVVNDVARVIDTDAFGLTPAALAGLTQLVDEGTITGRVAKELFGDLLTGADPRQLVQERGLQVLGDEADVQRVVDEVVAAHPDELAAYRGGKQGLRGFFVGQVMRATQGRADPQLVQRLVSGALDA